MQITHATQIQTEIINGKEISYILKANRKDIAHLVVTFNDYRHGGWSFSNTANFFKCNVLMIADVFENHQSCYMGKDGNDEFAYLVACLIERILARLGLTHENCTLLGASKGAYSALTIGIRYQFPNIVASAPFGHLGAWMVNHDMKIAKHVMGNTFDDKTVARYDHLLIDAIASDNNRNNKNIYMLVSPHDYFYLEYGQKELLLALNKHYDNFNAIYTHSDLAFQHNQVTVYFTQEILSITNLLSNGIIPRLGKALIDDIEFSQAAILPNSSATAIIADRKNHIMLPEKPINTISVLNTKEHRLYLEGDLYLQNYDAPDHTSLHKQLRLTNIASGDQQTHPLGTVPRAENRRELYQNTYFDYRASGVATMGLNGIDLSNLADGAHRIELSVTKQKTDQNNWQDVSLTKPIDTKTIYQNTEYHLSQRGKSIVLVKRPLMGSLDKEHHFELSKSWVDGTRFHVEGEFVVQGATMPEFYMGHYYLLAVHTETGQCYSYHLGQIRSKALCKKIGDIYENYLACSFATMHLKGIDTKDWEVGSYELFVSFSYGGEIYSKRLDNKLTVKNKRCLWQ